MSLGRQRGGVRAGGRALVVIGLAFLLSACGSTKVVVVTTTVKPRAPKPPSLTTLLARVRSGVVRIETTTCSGGEIGTGIVIGPRLIATVEHVVDGATSIALKQNGKQVATGTVVGSDPTRDVALVASSRPLAGYRFRFARRAPQLGETVTAIGFPLGLPLTVTQGLVSGLDRTIPINGIKRARMVQTDASINPGNSGGPLLTNTGQVVGLVDLKSEVASGLAFAVSADVAGPLLASWSAAPQPQPASTCTSGAGSTSQAAAAPTTTTPPAATTAPTIVSYNGGDFTIDYPSSWQITHISEGGGNVDTTLSPPGYQGVLMRVDEQPSATVSSPGAAAAPVIAGLRKETGYVELGLTDETFAGIPALRWEFEVPENGVVLHKIDEFFIDSSGRGWGVLVEAPASVWPQVESAFETLRSTFATT